LRKDILVLVLGQEVVDLALAVPLVGLVGSSGEKSLHTDGVLSRGRVGRERVSRGGVSRGRARKTAEADEEGEGKKERETGMTAYVVNARLSRG
jgi:hypothetical protein